MKVISFKCSQKHIAGLDELVRREIFISRAEAIRYAVYILLQEELYELRFPFPTE